MYPQNSNTDILLVSPWKIILDSRRMLIVSDIASGYHFTVRLHFKNPMIQGGDEGRICPFNMKNTFTAEGGLVHNIIYLFYQRICPIFLLQFTTDSWVRKSPAGLFYPRGMPVFHIISLPASFDYNCFMISCKTSALVCIVHHLKFHWN